MSLDFDTFNTFKSDMFTPTKKGTLSGNGTPSTPCTPCTPDSTDDLEPLPSPKTPSQRKIPLSPSPAIRSISDLLSPHRRKGSGKKQSDRTRRSKSIGCKSSPRSISWKKDPAFRPHLINGNWVTYDKLMDLL